MPNKPDYPDWRDTEPPKEEPKRIPPPDPKLVGTGTARAAADAIKKRKEETERLLEETR